MKRLIVLCDGTGNSATRLSDELATNVKRLADALEPNFDVEGHYDCNVHTNHSDPSSPLQEPVCPRCPGTKQMKRPQVTFYQPGVGTSTGMGDLSHYWQTGTGAGIDDNILDAYHFLASNYTAGYYDKAKNKEIPGDEIFIFGFSRGAFTARVLANLVIQLGLFKKHRLWMMRKAWKQYAINDGGASFKYFTDQLWKVDANCTRKVRVKVLGVWDTVDSVGVPDYMDKAPILNAPNYYTPHLVHVDSYEVLIYAGIEHVFHALAIDEYRRTFNPTLFFLPDPATKPVDCPPTILRQCWFPGVHSNIGGSYPSEHLADITLAWMIDQCTKHGNLLQFDRRRLEFLVTRHQNPGENKDPFHTGGDRHYPGWGCGTIYDSFKGSNTFLTWQYRCPGNYCKIGEHRGDTGVLQLPAVKWPKWVPYLGGTVPHSDEYCTDPECLHPGNKAPVKGATNETIHASVFARYKGSIQERTAEERAEIVKLEKLEDLNIHRAELKKERAIAVSLLTWDPEALSVFRYEKPATQSERYRRVKDQAVGAWKWTGRCLKTGKLFDMWEEPDVIGEACGLGKSNSEGTVYAEQVTFPAGELVAWLKGDLIKPPEFPESKPPTKEEITKRLTDHNYLQENFNFKSMKV